MRLYNYVLQNATDMSTDITTPVVHVDSILFLAVQAVWLESLLKPEIDDEAKRDFETNFK